MAEDSVGDIDDAGDDTLDKNEDGCGGGDGDAGGISDSGDGHDSGEDLGRALRPTRTVRHGLVFASKRVHPKFQS